MSICVPACLSVCLFLFILSLSLSADVSVCYVSVCLSVCTSCKPACLSFCFCLYVSLCERLFAYYKSVCCSSVRLSEHLYVFTNVWLRNRGKCHPKIAELRLRTKKIKSVNYYGGIVAADIIRQTANLK